ncbi:NAD(P)H dehydrogenase (quinone) [Homoserinimonas aerilata]|uniref:NAD(P)H dehydrogenase (Quinone) n=1 Tax=Homoserinimonas aerilata TaxID=1162970 RepID=A0A542YI30_9MICO|nr:SDR family oxidoreductase [Homoserinimonas aerilata]TQL47732.1 NAD(P)H dehydrogenase (quinone) [Homoserinimonas aerilata]
MTLALTGATGHLGRLVLESLLARGVAPDDIVAIGRDTSKLADFAERGVQLRTADYSKPETLAAAFEGVDRLLLISGSEVGQRVKQHGNVIDAAKDAGVGFIAYTSAPRADTSDLVLAPEHKATEQLIRDSGIPFSFLRNGWYTENYVQVAQQAKHTGLIIASLGDGTVASASRKDFADAAAVVLAGPGHENSVYELSGDTAWGYEELAQVVSDIVGREVTYKRVSSKEHRTILTKAGLPMGQAGFVVSLDTNTRDGALGLVTGDLARLIGRPTTPLAEGLAEAYAAAE